jgi:hypothetical protein
MVSKATLIITGLVFLTLLKIGMHFGYLVVVSTASYQRSTSIVDKEKIKKRKKGGLERR